MAQRDPADIITVRTPKGRRVSYELASNPRIVGDKVVADILDALTGEKSRIPFDMKRVIGWVFGNQVHAPHR